MFACGTKQRLGNVHFCAACEGQADIDQRRRFMSTRPNNIGYGLVRGDCRSDAARNHVFFAVVSGLRLIPAIASKGIAAGAAPVTR